MKALALAVVLAAPAAWACSCAGVTPIHLPVAGATHVPTNVQFLFGGSGDTIQLLGPGDVVLEFFTPQAMQRVAPKAPLAPNTDYVLRVDRSKDVKFHTGSGPDVTPPLAGDFSSTRTRTTILSPCGAVEYLTLTPTGFSDDSTPSDQLHYELFAGKTESTIDSTHAPVLLSNQPLISGGGACLGRNFPVEDWGFAARLVAVDLAGNKSEQTVPHQLKSCGCSSAAGLPWAAMLLLLALRRRA